MVSNNGLGSRYTNRSAITADLFAHTIYLAADLSLSSFLFRYFSLLSDFSFGRFLLRYFSFGRFLLSDFLLRDFSFRGFFLRGFTHRVLSLKSGLGLLSLVSIYFNRFIQSYGCCQTDDVLVNYLMLKRGVK